MEDPLLPLHNSNKKRSFAESSSSSFLDPDVIEIPPPSSWKSNSSKKKSIAGGEIIDVDDEDPEEVVIIGETIVSSDKGKKLMLNYLAGNDVITLEDFPSPQVNIFVKEITQPSTNEKGNSIQSPILQKLELFKKFDTLEDHSGHFYDTMKEYVKPSKRWASRIADEWRMLEKDLPDTIYVRVYEGRMDLLRAVLMGADGTPYHDGLFFFDVHFTVSYPSKPPLVNYHAHGLRINPNLYTNGKVCLSLLGTWSGSGAENWRSGKSNMLQVLLSIQGLVLNAEPYYNEPGFASSRNTAYAKQESKKYTENAFLLSLKTMLYTMRNPPKHFEDLVNGHFYYHAHDILAACRAYLDGVEVGSYVKGKTHAKQGKNTTCSQLLKSSLPGSMKSLVEAFAKIGVKDCEKYLVSVNKSPDCPPTRGRPSTSRSKGIRIK